MKKNHSIKANNKDMAGLYSSGKKAVLIVASVASMIDQFNIPNIKLLISMGYQVDVAANFIAGSTCTDQKIRELLQLLDLYCVDCYQVDFSRKVSDACAVIRAFRQLDAVAAGEAAPMNTYRHHFIKKAGGYHFVHAHSPIGGVVGRIIAKKHHSKTIYTAHGFHFYDGAPKQNWAIYYPVEWMLSWITDTLITINKEDYRRAKKYFHAKRTVYIPGIGIDTEKFRGQAAGRQQERERLKLAPSDIMLLSVGELNENKNHKAVIEALGTMGKYRGRLQYFIAGKGTLAKELSDMAQKLGVNLHLLGFRTDVPKLLQAADLFILPSIREGLNVGMMEAMAAGLPVVAGNIRGNVDFIKDGKGGYLVDCLDAAGFAAAIKKVVGNGNIDAGRWNQHMVKRADTKKILETMKTVYAPVSMNVPGQGVLSTVWR